MSVLSIIELPDERLRQISAAVDSFDQPLAELIDNLFETLAHRGGIGLCAPQVGVLRRVLVIHVPDDDYGARAYVNPEILAKAAPGFVAESCLSVPGIEGNVIRSTRVHIRAQDRSGEFFEAQVDGMHAVCLQHEIDHLEGRLFIDRLSWFKKLRLRLQAARAPRAKK